MILIFPGGTRESQPCKEAYLLTIDDWDQRTYKTPDHFNKRNGIKWFSEGDNHGTNAVGIYRRRGTRRVWAVTFESLEELSRFITRMGKVIIVAKIGAGIYDYIQLESE